MFIDASALVAILADEPDAAAIEDAIQDASTRLTSGLAVFEAVLAVRRRRDVSLAEAESVVRSFLHIAGITMIPLAESETGEALSAFARFGKGQGHPARLNLGDCFAYACARTQGVPLLFVGNDFARTDIPSAMT